MLEPWNFLSKDVEEISFKIDASGILQLNRAAFWCFYLRPRIFKSLSKAAEKNEKEASTIRAVKIELLWFCYSSTILEDA